MSGLDTNVLVRYIVQDDPRQAMLATRHVESRCTPDTPGRIGTIVLCELSWVLSRGYGYDRETVSSVIRRILSSPELLVEEDEAVWQALGLYEKGTTGFADYLIAILNHRHGASPTATFDRKAAREPLFELLA